MDLIEAAEALAVFPRRGRAVPEAKDMNIRERIFRGYRIIYHVEVETVSILAVVHGSREIGLMEAKPWDV